MQINNIAIVGLGALGVMYAHSFTKALGKESVTVCADRARIERYEREGIYFNGEKCDFTYRCPADMEKPASLVMFATKFGALQEAIELARPIIDENTTLIAVLNGISSEQVLAEAFGEERVISCVAQKMAALKEGNRARCLGTGNLALGCTGGQSRQRLAELTDFLDRAGFPYELPEDITEHMWGKLLCNTGLNQTVMVYEGTYATIHRPGEARDMMIGAMREVVKTANSIGIGLSEKHVQEWLDVIDHLEPTSEPSMRQDGKAKRYSEVELFSGTIMRIAAENGVDVPVCTELYRRVKEIESTY